MFTTTFNPTASAKHFGSTRCDPACSFGIENLCSLSRHFAANQFLRDKYEVLVKPARRFCGLLLGWKRSLPQLQEEITICSRCASPLRLRFTRDRETHHLTTTFPLNFLAAYSLPAGKSQYAWSTYIPHIEARLPDTSEPDRCELDKFLRCRGCIARSG